MYTGIEGIVVKWKRSTENEAEKPKKSQIAESTQGRPSIGARAGPHNKLGVFKCKLYLTKVGPRAENPALGFRPAAPNFASVQKLFRLSALNRNNFWFLVRDFFRLSDLIGTTVQVGAGSLYRAI